MTSLPQSVEATTALLSDGGYIADEATATAVFLSLKLQRPLPLEGDAGVGKTEIAKVLSEQLGRALVRLQCYEGLDTSNALYEWNYQRQLLHIRAAEAEGKSLGCSQLEDEIFSSDYLLRRPLLQALEAGFEGQAPVLLIDELDRAILELKVPNAAERLTREIVAFVNSLRGMDLYKSPGVAEAIAWAEALSVLNAIELEAGTIDATLGTLLKYQDDIARIQGSEAAQLLSEVKAGIASAEADQLRGQGGT
ncbi:MAG: AAA family ATPase [Hyphomicrobiaceae bacterium TMED74]|nr:ATPase [Filomicrobium sp.]RPG39866.1 MAG: AAA family ATPase [Hyphomicrobiaceae bacterium TMED74]